MVNKLNDLIFEYFEARILFGFYRFGDRLPSILKITEIFHMAPATVRAALSRLEKEGYIMIDARKAAKVIYRADSSQLRENAARYFLPRKEGIIDLSAAAGYLLEPLWKSGLLLWDEHHWNLLYKGLTTPSAAPTVPVEFYLLAAGALDNQLALNLLGEILRYLRFPYLVNGMDPYPGTPDQELPAKEDLIEFIRQQADSSYHTSLERLFDFTERAAWEYPDLDRTPISFQWNIYRRRPQLKYTFASRLIRKIMSGSYPEGSFLPSLPQLVKEYGIPLMTVRRTLEILEEAGLTRSHQGKGTQVSITRGRIDLSSPVFYQGLRLYRESLQLLYLTVHELSVKTLKAADLKQLEQLQKRFEELDEERKSYLCIDVCLTFLASCCPFSIVRECYEKLIELLAWGYPLVITRLGDRSLNEEYEEPFRQLWEALKKGDAVVFSTALESLLRKEWELSRSLNG